MVIRVGALWAIGVIVAMPFVLWWARDFARIPGRTWFWSGFDPRPWRWAVFLGLLAGGVIAIVTVFRWRRSDARDELLDELRERRAEHAARHTPARHTPARHTPARDASVLPLQRTVTGPDARTAARRASDDARRHASG